MPQAAPKPCVDCGALVRDGTARCEQHKVRFGQFGDERRGTRHERGYGTAWDRRRARVLKRDSGLCQADLKEGRVVAGSHVDHIVNKAEWLLKHGNLQGVDDDSNLQTLCPKCHKEKTRTEQRRGGGRSKG